ncbi:MAG: hypothetical protein R3E66_16385 [bacterium]
MSIVVTRTNLLTVNNHVPLGRGSNGGGNGLVAVLIAFDDDDVAAFLAANLEDLSLDLLVGNRIFCPT